MATVRRTIEIINDVDAMATFANIMHKDHTLVLAQPSPTRSKNGNE